MLPPLTSSQSHPVPTTVTYEKKFKFLNFAKQSIKEPASTGAVAPSSRYLVEKVIHIAEITDARTVVELGPGTGAFTEQIQHHLADHASFFALELNKTFVDATRQRCPAVTVYHDAADQLPKYLEKNKLPQCDLIISSLPWTIFENAEQDRLLDTIATSLKPGGKFISIVYLGAKARARGRYFINSLPLHFQSIQKSKTIWQNLPPTQVYRCSN